MDGAKACWLYIDLFPMSFGKPSDDQNESYDGALLCDGALVYSVKFEPI